MIHAYNCTKTAWQLCLGCGARVCACHGTARGQCPECYTGLLTDYYKLPTKCGYAKCANHAVTAAPRVGYACADHARAKMGYPRQTHEGDGKGAPTWRTTHVMRELGIAE